MNDENKLGFNFAKLNLCNSFKFNSFFYFQVFFNCELTVMFNNRFSINLNQFWL